MRPRFKARLAFHLHAPTSDIETSEPGNNNNNNDNDNNLVLEPDWKVLLEQLGGSDEDDVGGFEQEEDDEGDSEMTG